MPCSDAWRIVNPYRVRDDDNSNDPRARRSAPAVRTATFASPPAVDVSNKPMVPTAPSSPVRSPPRPLRRHIGQPLD